MNPSTCEQKNVAPMNKSVANLRVINSGLRSLEIVIPEMFIIEMLSHIKIDSCNHRTTQQKNKISNNKMHDCMFLSCHVRFRMNPHYSCLNVKEILARNKKTKTLWPLFFMDGVQLLQGYSHFEKAVYFLPLSYQKLLVLILLTLEG